MKSTQSEQWLITHGQTGVKGLPAAVITFIGICEILGVFGLILPWWFNIAPVLTPTAAICLHGHAARSTKTLQIKRA